MNNNLNNVNRRNKIGGGGDAGSEGNNDKIDNPLGHFLEKSRNMISQYIDAKTKSSKEIKLKKEELNIKREREDAQRRISRIREDGERERKRLEEDAQIKKEEEIMEFEEGIKLMCLKKKLGEDFERFQKGEKIIPLNEESGEQNMDVEPKKKSKKTKGKKAGVHEN